jgi:hypothetical protein
MRTTKLTIACVVLTIAALSSAHGAEIGGPHSMSSPAVNQIFDPYQDYRIRVLIYGRVVAGVETVCWPARPDSKVESDREEKSARALHDALMARANQKGQETVVIPDARIFTRAIGCDDNSPGRWAKWEAFTLVRGVTHDPGFEQWMKGGHRGVRDVRLATYNLAGNMTESWSIHRAWVSQYSAQPVAEVGSNTTVIEQIKLENEGWEQDVLPPKK